MKALKLFPLVCLLLVLSACKGIQSPPELVGVWKTEDARYVGKFLQFDEKFVVTGFGEEQFPKVQKITKMKVEVLGVLKNYDFDLRDEQGNTDHIRLQYIPSNGGEVQLSNPRNVVWHKFKPEE